MRRQRTWWNPDLSATCLRALGLGALLVLLMAGRAQAHTSLVGSTPADGATLENEPTRISLEFDETLAQPAFVVITAPDGTNVGSGPPEVSDTRVRADVENTGLAGEFTLAFRVVSTDGHTLSEELTYTVSSGRTVTASTVIDSTDSSAGLFQGTHFVHLVLGGGGVVAAAFVLYGPRRRRRE